MANITSWSLNVILKKFLLSYITLFLSISLSERSLINDHLWVSRSVYKNWDACNENQIWMRGRHVAFMLKMNWLQKAQQSRPCSINATQFLAFQWNPQVVNSFKLPSIFRNLMSQKALLFSMQDVCSPNVALTHNLQCLSCRDHNYIFSSGILEHGNTTKFMSKTTLISFPSNTMSLHMSITGALPWYFNRI